MKDLSPCAGLYKDKFTVLGNEVLQVNRLIKYIFSRILPFGRRPNGKIVCTVLCVHKKYKRGLADNGKIGILNYLGKTVSDAA